MQERIGNARAALTSTPNVLEYVSKHEFDRVKRAGETLYDVFVKQRDELVELRAHVGTVEDENVRLKARLAALEPVEEVNAVANPEVDEARGACGGSDEGHGRDVERHPSGTGEAPRVEHPGRGRSSRPPGSEVDRGPRPALIEQIQATFDCEFCGATPGTPCTLDGYRRFELHTARLSSHSRTLEPDARKNFWAQLHAWENAPCSTCSLETCGEPADRASYVTTWDGARYRTCKAHGNNYVRSETIRKTADPIPPETK
jgi:hypothetical protein